MRVLITGANGQLGQCLRDVFAASEHEIVLVDRTTFDLALPEQLSDRLNLLKPDVLINAAAYTAVDKAESEPELANKVNTQSPAIMAVWCSKHQVPFIHISTDYVFDGLKDRPYKEDDPVDPQGVYGATKLAGEQAVLMACPHAVVIRTAWVFSEYGQNFVKTMLRLGTQRDELGIVADQHGCPTYAGDLALAVKTVLSHLLAGENAGGVYHYCGNEVVSWFEFAVEIFHQAVQSGILEKQPVLKAIKTEDYPTPAKRPLWSALDCSKIAERFGIVPSDWKRRLMG